MNMNICRIVAISAVIAIAPPAFAAGLDGLEYQKERTVKLKNGKVVTVIIGKMNGHMMAVVPMDIYNDQFLRAEGHSMSD